MYTHLLATGHRIIECSLFLLHFMEEMTKQLKRTRDELHSATQVHSTNDMWLMIIHSLAIMNVNKRIDKVFFIIDLSKRTKI